MSHVSVPAEGLTSPGDSVSGRIIDYADFQLKDPHTEGPQFSPDREPVMGVFIALGPLSSGGPLVRIWAEERSLLRAIAGSVRAAGAQDINIGDHLTLTRIEGPGESYCAEYAVMRLPEVV